MSQILSQDEVDALLKGVNDGSVPAGEDGGTRRGGVQTLDLTSQERSLRGRLPTLEVIVERFGKALRPSLGTFFGQLPTVIVAGLELMKFATFMQRLAPPTSLQLFRMAPLRGQGAMLASPPLVAALLQVLFGGKPSRKTPIAAREFSAIEQRVLERFAVRVLQDFQDAWRPVVPLEFVFVRSESNPRFATIAAGPDLVLVLEMRVEVEGAEDAIFSLCIPNGALDPVRGRLGAMLDAPAEEPGPAWGDRWRALIASAELGLVAELGTRRMALRDVVALKAGDLLQLGTGRDGPVLVRIEGRPRFLGAPGVSGGNNAVRVTARL
jgi:flagellar motor switch protein FliM